MTIKSNNKIKGHLALVVANTCFGLMAPFSKIAMLSGLIGPILVTQSRTFGGMILFWIASFFIKREKIEKKDFIAIFFAGFLAIVLNQSFYLWGISLSNPGEGAIFTTAMPVFTLILSAIILKEAITKSKIIGISCAIVGALILMLSSPTQENIKLASTEDRIMGDIIIVTGQLFFALYLVKFKYLIDKYSLFTIMKWMCTFSFICLLPFSFKDIATLEYSKITSSEIYALIFVVVGGTFISYIMMLIGQKNLGPTITAMYNYMQPIIACIFAIALGLDSFTIIKIFGALLVFYGVYKVVHKKKVANK